MGLERLKANLASTGGVADQVAVESFEEHALTVGFSLQPQYLLSGRGSSSITVSVGHH